MSKKGLVPRTSVIRGSSPVQDKYIPSISVCFMQSAYSASIAS